MCVCVCVRERESMSFHSMHAFNITWMFWALWGQKAQTIDKQPGSSIEHALIKLYADPPPPSPLSFCHKLHMHWANSLGFVCWPYLFLKPIKSRKLTCIHMKHSKRKLDYDKRFDWLSSGISVLHKQTNKWVNRNFSHMHTSTHSRKKQTISNCYFPNVQLWLEMKQLKMCSLCLKFENVVVWCIIEKQQQQQQQEKKIFFTSKIMSRHTFKVRIIIE